MKARLYYLRKRTGKAAVAVNVKTRRAGEPVAAPAST
jgi:ribosomal protein L19